LRTTPRERLAHTTVEQALAHPNWRMGPRITIGSATLMNKALEIIELHHLFGLERERIEVVVHPQSVVHSMVEFVDGSVIAQLGPPDMRVPIHYALHHPDRAPSPYAGFDVRSMANLSFEAPDLERFPALALGWRVIAEGSDAGAVLNAADEVAVEAFLAGRIGFTDITRLVERALTLRPGLDQSISALLQADAQARELTANLVHQTAAARAVT
jgi:1-deoxy-D-xylulose-5-phosphate reductoisomerase